MKKRSKIAIYGLITGGLLFLITNLAGSLIQQSGAKEKNEKKTTKTESVKETKAEKNPCCVEEESSEFSDNSIYQLESKWINQSGEKFRIGSLKGKPVVLTMFYASCTYACPLLINDMKKIEASIDAEDLKNYRFVLVSIDPEKDKPEVLAEVVKKNNLDTKRWTLLTGSEDDIMELAALIGFKFKKDEKEGYSHSNLITFLNDKGEIIHQQVGLNQDITQSISVLNKLN
jgi:protein SCO1/2